MNSFADGQEAWIARLGNLRNTVRQEVIRRQLAAHAPAGASVLDVGCGQGTQAIALAALGCRVTGVEPSAELRDLCARSADAAGVRVELVEGTIERLDDAVGDRCFDVVAAHGLLMYLDDPAAALATLGARVAVGGFVSFTFRNADGLALRPALRRDWEATHAAFDAAEADAHYVNGLGVGARADRLVDIGRALDELGFTLDAWYGVRVLTDAAPGDERPPTGAELDRLLLAEDRAGRTDPYRSLGAQLHVISRRR